jgi:hypothetical protein
MAGPEENVEPADRVQPVALNEITNLLGALRTPLLREVLVQLRPGNPVAGCDSECICRGGMCGCNAIVSSYEKFDLVSLPEYQRLREERIKELREALSRLEGDG